MTTKQMIEVMQAYENGEQIEYRGVGVNTDWVDIRQPNWDWVSCEYRAKPKQIEPAILDCYINPKKEADALVKSHFSLTIQTQNDFKVRDLLWYWEFKNDDGSWSMIIDSNNNPLRTTWEDLSDEDKYLFEARPILSMGFRIPTKFNALS